MTSSSLVLTSGTIITHTHHHTSRIYTRGLSSRYTSSHTQRLSQIFKFSRIKQNTHMHNWQVQSIPVPFSYSFSATIHSFAGPAKLNRYLTNTNTHHNNNRVPVIHIKHSSLKQYSSQSCSIAAPQVIALPHMRVHTHETHTHHTVPHWTSDHSAIG